MARFGPFECPLWHIYEDLLVSSVREHLYSAYVVGYEIEVVLNDRGISV